MRVRSGLRCEGCTFFSGSLSLRLGRKVCLVHAHVGVEIDDEGVGRDEHGVELEAGEGEGVAGGLAGGEEELAHEVGGVELHLGGHLAAEERDEEEVELAGVGEFFDAGVAEADGLAFGDGDEGDLGDGGEGDAEAGAVEAGAEFGTGVDADDEAVVAEGELGVIGVDEAGGVGVAAEIEAGFGGGEDLGDEGALEGGGGDADFDGVSGERQKGKGEEESAGRAEGHGRRIPGVFLGIQAQVIERCDGGAGLSGGGSLRFASR